jgi:hypothetical protein
MGIFTAIREKPTDRVARATLSLPLLIAAGEGRPAGAELTRVSNICAYSPVFQAIGPARTHEIALDLLDQLEEKGAEALLARARRALPPKLRETALCLAIRTALAEGTLSDADYATIKAMAQEMEIPSDTVARMFEVMVMLQRAAA